MNRCCVVCGFLWFFMMLWNSDVMCIRLVLLSFIVGIGIVLIFVIWVYKFCRCFLLVCSCGVRFVRFRFLLVFIVVYRLFWVCLSVVCFVLRLVSCLLCLMIYLFWSWYVFVVICWIWFLVRILLRMMFISYVLKWLVWIWCCW